MLLLQEQPSLTSEEPFLRATQMRQTVADFAERSLKQGRYRVAQGKGGTEGLHPRCSYPPESVEESEDLVLNLITRAIKP